MGSPAASTQRANSMAHSGVALAGFSTHGAAGRQRRRDLADRQHQREVPRRDRADDADRLAHHQVPLAVGLVRDHAAVGPARLLGEPEQVIDGHRDLALRLRQRLAVLQRDQAGDLVPARGELAGDGAQVIAARLGGQRAPAGERRLRVLQRLPDAGAVDGGHLGERLVGGRVDDLEHAAAGVPLPVQKQLVAFHGVTPFVPGLRCASGRLMIRGGAGPGATATARSGAGGAARIGPSPSYFAAGKSTISSISVI